VSQICYSKPKWCHVGLQTSKDVVWAEAVSMLMVPEAGGKNGEAGIYEK